MRIVGSREILKTEATKKFIEKRIRELLIDKYFHAKVLKRNPGHISLIEVDIIPQPENIREISKICREKIEFKLRKINEWKEFEYMQNDLLKREKRRLKKKAKRRRKRILKTIYRGFAPNHTSF
jgi:hypothetical protein